MFGSSKKPKTDYKALWENYRSWQQEDKDWYERTMSDTKSRFAASGAAPGTARYDRAISDIEEQYKQKQETLEGGMTKRTLQSMYDTKVALERRGGAFGGGMTDPMQDNYREPDPKEIEERLTKLGSFEDFFTREYGDPTATATATAPAPGDATAPTGGESAKVKPKGTFGTVRFDQNPWLPVGG